MTRACYIISRRSFLKTASLAAGGSMFSSCVSTDSSAAAVLRFGVISDVHQDIMHDSRERVRAFVDAMRAEQVDFICQLGDFCQPRPGNQPFMEEWKRFAGTRYHVLGNHDMDGGFSRAQTVAFYGMPAPYYSFDQKGVHVIVLDGNEKGGRSKGYPRFVSEKQLAWLAADLEATALPTLVLSHQTLEEEIGLENGDAVRRVLEAATLPSGFRKVVACFCGHHHDDHARQINGIHYVRINSASYLWLGGAFKHESYSKEIHKQFPWIASTVPYQEPLWAIVEVDTSAGTLAVRGSQSTWVGPSPWERGCDRKTVNPAVCAPRISDRLLSWQHKAVQ